jgi:ornithine--oxo-acid transaminase
VPFGDIDALAAQLQAGDVAALVIEPIQGKGVNLAPDDFWPAAEELCRRHQTLLVMDEVQTGLGRTGAFFCHEHWGLHPDIITVSKALSGGYLPVGAMLCSARVSDSVYSSMDRAVVHSSTFGGNQLAMVAGLATLQAFDEENIVERAGRNGQILAGMLEPLVERYEFLHAVRGKGLMIGLVFGEPESKALRRRWRAVESIRTALFSQLIVVPLFHRHRILTQVAADNMNVVKLLPPLIIGEQQIDYFVRALEDVLSSAEKGSGLYLEFGRTLAGGSLHRLRS